MLTNAEHNTKNLRYDASFETLISKDVYWVPINTLGKTARSNSEIKDMVNLSPQEKRANINNLYEAIQLFQVGSFREELDVVIIKENDYVWEHHKPSIYSVLSNCGCCSSIASWLNFMIKNKYEQTGYFSLSRPNGSGHVMNYIYHNNWYYLIDLLPMVEQYVDTICSETGRRIDFMKSKYITGILAKSKSLESYVNFYRRIQLRGGFEHLFFYSNGHEVGPMSNRDNNNKKIICFSRDEQVICLSDTKVLKTLDYEFVDPPKKLPDWGNELVKYV